MFKVRHFVKTDNLEFDDSNMSKYNMSGIISSAENKHLKEHLQLLIN